MPEETECPGCDRCADFAPMQRVFVMTAEILQQIGNQIGCADSPEDTALILGLDTAIVRAITDNALLDLARLAETQGVVILVPNYTVK